MRIVQPDPQPSYPAPASMSLSNYGNTTILERQTANFCSTGLTTVT